MNIDEIKIIQNIPDIIEFINELFDSAIKDNISDIHIETTKDFILVRFRKD
jgi:type II secretory ATPase GspE/PulE/Tfp pilus assembly ATPase PilB-like protein